MLLILFPASTALVLKPNLQFELGYGGLSPNYLTDLIKLQMLIDPIYGA
ncbi:MAG: hypothetical protein ACI9U0_001889 [Flavobacteriales bacterium]|jgi:hypothetical protein|tara:strand:- start:2933 stop:3079 length:147 start_codon:yes stop_codon:yes gene_type:complete